MFTGSGLICARGERVVFRALDFALAPGAALVLTGRNGAGKTSLLRLMAGLLPPAGGALRWGGKPIDADAHRARLRYAGHADALKGALTARENLSFWAALDGDGAAGVEPALDRFGLAARADTQVRFLSAGQRRRTTLARLLLAPRELWLLDEPTASLDADAVAALAAAIAAHRARGGMVALAAHGAPPVSGHETLDIDRHAAAAA